MDNLIIEKTQNTLGVSFNAANGACTLTGSSYPEDSVKFFKPLISWIKKYGKQGAGSITLDLRVTYINTSSTKCILDIFKILEDMHKKSGKVKINWYYPKDDDDARETGEELIECIDIPVKFISYKG